MNRALLVSLALSFAAGCGSAAASSTSLRSANEPPKPPTFIEDDYARALAEAKAKDKPLFIDTWAPWCHTCLSMRAYVFKDPALAPLAKEFVWLSVDTEKAENAKFMERYAIEVWPTLWVIDAKTEKPALKWLGSATTPELVSLLEDAKAAALHGDTQGQAGALFLQGNKATAAGDRAEAARDYKAALAAAPPGWAKRPRVVEALVERLDELKDWDGSSSPKGPRVNPVR